jgi:prenyltransferase beta subunit
MSWQLSSMAIVGLMLAFGLFWFERTRPPAKVVALVATLAALATVGRIAFAPFPNVKPTTDIVLFAGFAIGAAPGFAVGATTGLASNVFFGQGPWTPWQMAGWGMVGVLGGVLGVLMKGREPRRLPLALVCAAAGFAYGALLDFYQWTLAATHNLDSYLAVSGTSLPYNLAHAVGNFVFALAIGPAFVRALRRYRRRFEVRWLQPVAAATIAAGLLVSLATPPAEAASPRQKALDYLVRAQNPDGGFGGAPRQSSSQLYTGWVGLGFAAAGRNPRDVRHIKSTPISYTRKHLRKLDVGELERTILLVRSSGLSPRNFGHRDLLAQLTGERRANGSWEDLVDHTAFGILALRASGVSPSKLQDSVRWLEDQQNTDGGFGFGPKGGSSDADDTGSTIQALVAAGLKRDAAVRKAVSYLRRSQNADGGFGQMKDDTSNAMSTAWAVQGLVAAGRNPRAFRRSGHDPLSYIVSLQSANGAVRYSRTSAQTPVWATAEALTALARRPYPIPAPRRKAPVGVAKPSTSSSSTPAPAAPKKTKPPSSHGQTIAPAKHKAKQRAKQTNNQTTALPQPIATTASPDPGSRIPHPVQPSTTHGKSKHNGYGALPLALAAVALATVLAGFYLTRRRLRGRSRPA